MSNHHAIRLASGLIAFLVLPGVVAITVPILIGRTDPWHGSGWGLGWAVWLVGMAILLCCVRDFFAIGRGTLAPWDPPKTLVIVGLYRFARNPMYVGVFTTIVGWSLIFGSWLVVVYALLVASVFHLQVVFYEERVLSRQFPADWQAYARAVPRWIPRIKAGVRNDR